MKRSSLGLRLGSAGLVAAATALLSVATAGQVHAATDGVVAGTNLRSTLTAMPGAQWETEDAICSLGWIVHDETAEYAVTAGHCGDAGETATLQGRRLGTVTTSEHRDPDGTPSLAVDYAAIRLDPSVPVSDRVPGFASSARRVMTAAELVEARPDLCVVGQRSGLNCGSFDRMRGGGTEQALFNAPTLHGDSGGAVFAVSDDGEVTAVGVLLGSPQGDPATSIVQLLAPILPTMTIGRL